MTLLGCPSLKQVFWVLYLCIDQSLDEGCPREGEAYPSGWRWSLEKGKVLTSFRGHSWQVGTWVPRSRRRSEWHMPRYLPQSVACSAWISLLHVLSLTHLRPSSPGFWMETFPEGTYKRRFNRMIYHPTLGTVLRAVSESHHLSCFPDSLHL